MAKHGDHDREPAVGHTAQSATVRVAAGSHLGIDRFAVRVAEKADPGPVVKSIAQALVAAPAHEHGGFLATLVCVMGAAPA